MFQINDVIVYENGGVCRIEDIGTPDFINSGQEYYKLQSLEDRGGTIYLKVERGGMLRSVISQEEAIQRLEGISGLEGCYDVDNKNREKEYAQVLKSSDCGRWLGMVKGIEEERARRQKMGKKLNASDDKNLQRAVSLLTSEFSVVLGIPRDEVKQRILSAI